MLVRTLRRFTAPRIHRRPLSISNSVLQQQQQQQQQQSHSQQPQTIEETKYGGFTRDFFKTMIESRSRLMKFMGLAVEDISSGRLVCRMPLKAALSTSARGGANHQAVLHNGIISALVDQVGGFSAWSLLESRGQFIATIDLRVDFVVPVPIREEGFIVCEATVVASDDKFIRSDVVCWNADRTQKVAIGTGLYNVYVSPLRKKDSPIIRGYFALMKRFPSQFAAVIDLAEYLAWFKLTYFPKKANKKQIKSREGHIGHHRCLQLQRGENAAAGHTSTCITSLASSLFQRDTFMREMFKMRLSSAEFGNVTLHLPYSDILLGNIFIPCLHGGVTAAALEYAGYACASTVLLSNDSQQPQLQQQQNQHITTVNFCINYLKPAPCVDMLIDAVLSNKGGTILTIAIVCWDKDRTVKIATGSGVYQLHK